MGFVEGVAAGLTVVAVVAVVSWLCIERNREALRAKLRKVTVVSWLAIERKREAFRAKRRQVTCRHDWQRIEPIGPRVIYVADHEEECRKCGAQR